MVHDNRAEIEKVQMSHRLVEDENLIGVGRRLYYVGNPIVVWGKTEGVGLEFGTGHPVLEGRPVSKSFEAIFKCTSAQIINIVCF